MYQQVNLSDHSPVGTPGPLPYVVAGWPDAMLLDLSQLDPSFGLTGMAFWPVVVTTPSYDATKQVVVAPASYTVDPATSTVTGTATVRDMTADEYAVANPVPDAVTNYQARMALRAAGLRDKVDAAIRGADQSVPANAEALDAWDYANQFFRDQPIIAAMQAVLGLSDAQVDDLFRAAAQVS